MCGLQFYFKHPENEKEKMFESLWKKNWKWEGKYFKFGIIFPLCFSSVFTLFLSFLLLILLYFFSFYSNFDLKREKTNITSVYDENLMFSANERQTKISLLLFLFGTTFFEVDIVWLDIKDCEDVKKMCKEMKKKERKNLN